MLFKPQDRVRENLCCGWAEQRRQTTLSEALRLVSIVSERYQSLNYKTPPSWLNLPLRYHGCVPSLQGLQINFDTIFSNYGDPPALITAMFSNGEKINIYLGSDYKIWFMTTLEGYFLAFEALVCTGPYSCD